MNFPYKAVTSSEEFSKPYDQQFKELLNISIANYGDKEVVLDVNGVKRILPAANPSPLVPTYAFVFDCNGIPFDIQIKVLFPNGSSKVVIDKSTIIQC